MAILVKQRQPSIPNVRIIPRVWYVWAFCSPEGGNEFCVSGFFPGNTKRDALELLLATNAPMSSYNDVIDWGAICKADFP